MSIDLRKLLAAGLSVGVLTGVAVGTLGSAATGAPAPTGFHLVMDLEGAGPQDLAQCVGIGDSTDVVVLQGQNGTSSVPGDDTVVPLVCTRVFDPGNAAFSDWRGDVVDGDSPGDYERSLSLILYDSTLAEQYRWNFFGAWPSALEVIPSADGSIREVVTIQAQHLDRVAP